MNTPPGFRSLRPFTSVSQVTSTELWSQHPTSGALFFEGTVGVGTALPDTSSSLHVHGDLRVDGVLIFNGDPLLVTDSLISPEANISLSKLERLAPNKLVITDESGMLATSMLSEQDILFAQNLVHGPPNSIAFLEYDAEAGRNVMRGSDDLKWQGGVLSVNGSLDIRDPSLTPSTTHPPSLLSVSSNSTIPFFRCTHHGKEVFSILDTGHVGVAGPASSLYALTVEGGVKCEELKVRSRAGQNASINIQGQGTSMSISVLPETDEVRFQTSGSSILFETASGEQGIVRARVVRTNTISSYSQGVPLAIKTTSHVGEVMRLGHFSGGQACFLMEIEGPGRFVFWGWNHFRVLPDAVTSWDNRPETHALTQRTVHGPSVIAEPTWSAEASVRFSQGLSVVDISPQEPWTYFLGYRNMCGTSETSPHILVSGRKDRWSVSFQPVAYTVNISESRPWQTTFPVVFDGPHMVMTNHLVHPHGKGWKFACVYDGRPATGWSEESMYINTMAIDIDGVVWSNGVHNGHSRGDGVGPDNRRAWPLSEAQFTRVLRRASVINSRIPTNGKVVKIQRSHFGIVILYEDGTVWGTGFTHHGMIAHPHTGWILHANQFRHPSGVPVTNVRDVAVGHSHTVILLNDGSVFGCGNNARGQLARPSLPAHEVHPLRYNTSAPVEDAMSVAVGAHHTVVVDRNGKAWVCGSNDFGQLGMGTLGGSVPYLTPLDLPYSVAAVMSGTFSDMTLFVTDLFTIHSAGRGQRNENGVGGIGANVLTPEPIPFVRWDNLDLRKLKFSIVGSTTASTFFVAHDKVHVEGDVDIRASNRVVVGDPSSLPTDLPGTDKLVVNGDVKVTGSLFVQGDLVVDADTNVMAAQGIEVNVVTSDSTHIPSSILTLNSGMSDPSPPPSLLSGLRVHRGAGNAPFFYGYSEEMQSWVQGFEGPSGFRRLATFPPNYTPHAGALVYWDQADLCLKADQNMATTTDGNLIVNYNVHANSVTVKQGFRSQDGVLNIVQGKIGFNTEKPSGFIHACLPAEEVQPSSAPFPPHAVEAETMRTAHGYVGVGEGVYHVSASSNTANARNLLSGGVAGEWWEGNEGAFSDQDGSAVGSGSQWVQITVPDDIRLSGLRISVPQGHASNGPKAGWVEFTEEDGGGIVGGFSFQTWTEGRLTQECQLTPMPTAHLARTFRIVFSETHGGTRVRLSSLRLLGSSSTVAKVTGKGSYFGRLDAGDILQGGRAVMTRDEHVAQVCMGGGGVATWDGENARLKWSSPVTTAYRPLGQQSIPCPPANTTLHHYQAQGVETTRETSEQGVFLGPGDVLWVAFSGDGVELFTSSQDHDNSRENCAVLAVRTQGLLKWLPGDVVMPSTSTPNIVTFDSETGEKSWMLSHSDERLKSNVETIPPAAAMDVVRKASPKYFDMAGRRHVGFIAQQLAHILPEVVRTNVHTGYMSVSYGNMAAVLASALQNIDERLQRIESQWSLDLRPNTIHSLKTAHIKHPHAVLKDTGATLHVQGDVRLDDGMMRNVHGLPFLSDAYFGHESIRTSRLSAVEPFKIASTDPFGVLRASEFDFQLLGQFNEFNTPKDGALVMKGQMSPSATSPQDMRVEGGRMFIRGYVGLGLGSQPGEALLHLARPTGGEDTFRSFLALTPSGTKVRGDGSLDVSRSSEIQVSTDKGVDVRGTIFAAGEISCSGIDISDEHGTTHMELRSFSGVTLIDLKQKAFVAHNPINIANTSNFGTVECIGGLSFVNGESTIRVTPGACSISSLEVFVNGIRAGTIHAVPDTPLEIITCQGGMRTCDASVHILGSHVSCDKMIIRQYEQGGIASSPLTEDEGIVNILQGESETYPSLRVGVEVNRGEHHHKASTQISPSRGGAVLSPGNVRVVTAFGTSAGDVLTVREDGAGLGGWGSLEPSALRLSEALHISDGCNLLAQSMSSTLHMYDYEQGTSMDAGEEATTLSFGMGRAFEGGSHVVRVRDEHRVYESSGTWQGGDGRYDFVSGQYEGSEAFLGHSGDTLVIDLPSSTLVVAVSLRRWGRGFPSSVKVFTRTSEGVWRDEVTGTSERDEDVMFVNLPPDNVATSRLAFVVSSIRTEEYTSGGRQQFFQFLDMLTPEDIDPASLSHIRIRLQSEEVITAEKVHAAVDEIFEGEAADDVKDVLWRDGWKAVAGEAYGTARIGQVVVYARNGDAFGITKAGWCSGSKVVVEEFVGSRGIAHHDAHALPLKVGVPSFVSWEPATLTLSWGSGGLVVNGKVYQHSDVMRECSCLPEPVESGDHGVTLGSGIGIVHSPGGTLEIHDLSKCSGRFDHILAYCTSSLNLKFPPLAMTFPSSSSFTPHVFDATTSTSSWEVSDSSPSDARLKHDIRDVTSTTDPKTLRGVTYRYGTEESTRLGFIAQEIMGVVPETVRLAEDGYYSVHYGYLMAFLSKMVAEVDERLRRREAMLTLA